ncbi:F-box/kelch-repeat protein At3g23880-like isoform X2 [Rutidosis leptorrhynchoides]|uniref:F-box/kelch-repeat protein At3g23880-like isoform X2 n=1 Tax=Rutidosis leptorrhynchoides TaxID=125765 RepID=UPI003A999FA1
MMSFYICDELLEDIFKILPSKTLLRFKYLSKYWCSRISSPDFILKQTTFQSARNYQNILIQHRTYHSENFYTVHYQSPLNSQYGNYGTRPMKFPKGCYIVGSCNGIICLRYFSTRDVSLWNPSIRRLFYVEYGEPHKSMVYSLKKRVWCEISLPSTRIMCVKSPACFVNGALHWVFVSYLSNAFILRFDLSTHVFSEIMLPEELNYREHIVCPIIFNGSLGMSVSNSCCTKIWVMKEDNNNRSWYMVLTLEDLQSKGGVRAVIQLKNGNMLIRNDKNVFEVGYPGAVCSEVCVPVYPAAQMFGMVMYVESLALLDIGTVCINADQPYFTRQQ